MAYKGTATYRTPSSFVTKVRYTQRPPYKPMPYRTYGSQTNAGAPLNGEFSTQSLNYCLMDPVGVQAKAYAKAYDKLVDKVRGESSAMLAVNVAERAQSFQMIGKRATQILTGLRQLRKFDLPGMLRTFGFKLRIKRDKPPQWVRLGKGRTYRISNTRVQMDTYALRRKAKSVGSLWLEYWFGWSPLISDIGGAVDVLQDRDLRLRNKFTSTGYADYTSTVVDGFSDGGWHKRVVTRTQSSGVRLSCVCVVQSPNSLKANQLGFVNPATVAWELIPFSFLVDWFLPVGRFLDSYTDFVGLGIGDAQRTDKTKASYTYVITGPTHRRSDEDNSFLFARSLLGEFRPPGLFDRTGNGIQSLTRAATAISLLTGFLKSSKWS